MGGGQSSQRADTRPPLISECLSDTCPGGVTPENPRVGLEQPTREMVGMRGTISHMRVYGKNRRAYGESGNVRADHCLVAGEGWDVRGNYNVVIGNDNHVFGHGNVILGSANACTGEHVFLCAGVIMSINDGDGRAVCELPSWVVRLYSQMIRRGAFDCFGEEWYHYMSQVRRIHLSISARFYTLPILDSDDFRFSLSSAFVAKELIESTSRTPHDGARLLDAVREIRRHISGIMASPETAELWAAREAEFHDRLMRGERRIGLQPSPQVSRLCLRQDRRGLGMILHPVVQNPRRRRPSTLPAIPNPGISDALFAR